MISRGRTCTIGNENCDYLLDENQRLKKMLVQKHAFMQNLIEAVQIFKANMP